MQGSHGFLLMLEALILLFTLIITAPVLVPPKLRLCQHFFYKSCCSREKHLTWLRKFASRWNIFFPFPNFVSYADVHKTKGWAFWLIASRHWGFLPLLSLLLSQFVFFLLISIPIWRPLMNGPEREHDLPCATARRLESWATKDTYRRKCCQQKAGAVEGLWLLWKLAGVAGELAEKEGGLVSQTATAVRPCSKTGGRNCWEEGGRDPSR